MKDKEREVHAKTLVQIDGISGIYEAYLNRNYYHNGYAPHFTLETAMCVIRAFNESCKKRGYKAELEFDAKQDAILHKDYENGCGAEVFKAENVYTPDGDIKLYYIGEDWQWQMADIETIENYGRCESCMNFGKCIECDGCNEGSNYSFDCRSTLD